MHGRLFAARTYSAAQPYAGCVPEISGYIVESSYINCPVRWTTTLSRCRGGADSPSAPQTSTRSSPTHRIVCAGSAASRLPVSLRASCCRSFAGSGSVTVRYAERNQKCRTSDLNNGVGIPVATTIREVRIEPPAVNTSAVLRSNVIRRTGDRSKITVPRSAAAAARPTHARYGSIDAASFVRRPAAASSAALPRTARRVQERGVAPDRARVQERRVESRVAPRFLIPGQPRHLLRRRRDGDGGARFE